VYILWIDLLRAEKVKSILVHNDQQCNNFWDVIEFLNYLGAFVSESTGLSILQRLSNGSSQNNFRHLLVSLRISPIILNSGDSLNTNIIIEPPPDVIHLCQLQCVFFDCIGTVSKTRGRQACMSERFHDPDRAAGDHLARCMVIQWRLKSRTAAG
jgi:hypothetical protein